MKLQQFLTVVNVKCLVLNNYVVVGFEHHVLKLLGCIIFINVSKFQLISLRGVKIMTGLSKKGNKLSNNEKQCIKVNKMYYIHTYIIIFEKNPFATKKNRHHYLGRI